MSDLIGRQLSVAFGQRISPLTKRNGAALLSFGGEPKRGMTLANTCHILQEKKIKRKKREPIHRYEVSFAQLASLLIFALKSGFHGFQLRQNLRPAEYSTPPSPLQIIQDDKVDNLFKA